MSQTDINAADFVVVARIGKVHGLKGWVRLMSYTHPQENVLGYRRFRTPASGQSGPTHGRELLMDQSRVQGNSLIVHFEGFDSPEQARELNGLDISVRAEELPELASGDYYWHQLQGLDVATCRGQLLGTVEKMLETGANDVMVVAPNAGSIDERERLIPYLTEDVIVEVSLEKGLITVDWEADYE
ncbi:MAG: ribosome maturation factor RimM [Pseudohongiellaceae bacterium]